MIERERAVYRFFSFLIKSKRLEDLVEDWALLRKSMAFTRLFRVNAMLFQL